MTCLGTAKSVFDGYVSKLVVLASLLVLPVVAMAQGQFSAPKYSNEFLSLGVGARGIGMGSAVTSISQDVTAAYWNPAGLAHTATKVDASLMHASYYAGLANFDYGGVALRLDSQSTLAFSFVRLAVDNIADTRFLIVNDVIDYGRIRRFSAADNALFISYARKSVFGMPELSMGGSAKIIYRNAGNFANAWGFGLDAGAQYRKGHLFLGAHLRDATSTFNAWTYNTSEIADIFARTGNVIPEASVEVTLPRLILGAGYMASYKQFHALAVLDAEITSDGARNTVVSAAPFSIDPRVGLEVNYDSLVYVRGGINQLQRVKSLDGSSTSWTMQPNFGIGLRLGRLNLDYALTNLGGSSESIYSHIFSLRFGFNKAR